MDSRRGRKPYIRVLQILNDLIQTLEGKNLESQLIRQNIQLLVNSFTHFMLKIVNIQDQGEFYHTLGMALGYLERFIDTQGYKSQEGSSLEVVTNFLCSLETKSKEAPPEFHRDVNRLLIQSIALLNKLGREFRLQQQLGAC